MINVKISPRLKAIAELVPSGSIILDVGTDHSYLPIYLVLNNQCLKAYASDLRKEPLALAKKNIEKYNLTSKIKTLLCFGISEEVSDANILIIAGMGKDNIIEILEQAKLNNFDKLILQANKKTPLLRSYIAKKGYYIEEEKLVYDSKRFYEIIVVNPHKKGIYNEKEILFGPYFLANKTPLLKRYWLEKVKSWLAIEEKTNSHKFDESIKFIMPLIK